MAATTTRLAPSPTGARHRGNARTFLVNYLLARQRRWRVLMRVEDLDGPRVKAGAADRQRAYRAALDRLIELGAAYPCTCSRKDIEAAASAPHRDGAAPAYPGTCRGRYASGEQAEAASGRPAAWRLRVKRRCRRPGRRPSRFGSQARLPSPPAGPDAAAAILAPAAGDRARRAAPGQAARRYPPGVLSRKGRQPPAHPGSAGLLVWAVANAPRGRP